MTRKRPDDRIERLVEIATEVFIASQGYQRTQMDEVARQLGVSKGSLYLYVESKEALFDLCVRYADDPDAVTRDELSLPYKSAGGEETLGYVQVRLAQDPAFQEMIGILLTERIFGTGTRPGAPCANSLRRTWPESEIDQVDRGGSERSSEFIQNLVSQCARPTFGGLASLCRAPPSGRGIPAIDKRADSRAAPDRDMHILGRTSPLGPITAAYRREISWKMPWSSLCSASF
jgi:AcrR family transcriptional regulator